MTFENQRFSNVIFFDLFPNFNKTHLIPKTLTFIYKKNQG
jgi:hypothetical protein